jgi:hypothetical protein
VVGAEGGVGLADGDGVAADFHGEISGGFDADGFETEILISGVAEVVEETLDGFGAVGGVVMRHHQDAIGREQGCGQVIVAGIERGNEILSEVADEGLDIHERTRIRHGTRVRPVHLTTSWGKARASDPTREAGLLSVLRHFNAPESVEREKFCRGEGEIPAGGWENTVGERGKYLRGHPAKVKAASDLGPKLEAKQMVKRGIYEISRRET